jgi:hypothetical protein
VHRPGGGGQGPAQLRRLEHLDPLPHLQQLVQSDLDLLGAEVKGQPAVGGRRGHRLRQLGLDVLPRRRVDAAPQPLDRAGVDEGDDLDGLHRLLEGVGRLGPVPAEIEALRAFEGLVEAGGLDDPAHPVGADVGAVAGDEVPDARLEHQAERVEAAVDLLTAPVVPDLDAAVVPQSVGNGGEMWQFLGALEPPRGVEVEPLPDPCRPAAELGGQGGEHLELGGGEHRAEPELGGGVGETGQQHGVGLVDGEAGQAGAVAVHEPGPAVAAGLAVHGHAGGAQRLEVPVDRPHRHLELPGQLRRRHLASGLEQQQELDEAGRTHAPTVRHKPDKQWHGCDLRSPA